MGSPDFQLSDTKPAASLCDPISSSIREDPTYCIGARDD